jgi:hypothetical protein
MYLVICFLLGIGNFAMHKAVIESGHPFVEDTKLYFGRYFGRHGSYLVEFGILVGTMLFAFSGAAWIIAFYAIYTACNAVAVWLLLTHRM